MKKIFWIIFYLILKNYYKSSFDEICLLNIFLLIFFENKFRKLIISLLIMLNLFLVIKLLILKKTFIVKLVK